METDVSLKAALQAVVRGELDSTLFLEAAQDWRRGKVSIAEILADRGWSLPSDSGCPAAVADPAPNRLPHAAGLETPTLAVGGGDEGCQSDETRDWEWADGRESPGTRPPRARRYERVRLIAQGGLGAVWLVRDNWLGREVALKELRADRRQHRSLLLRFDEEARITSRLEHPSIIPLYDLIPVEEGCGGGSGTCYTMRYVSGRTLHEAIRAYHSRRDERASSPVERNALLNAFVSVCEAVAFAHARGVLHRDLKGQNVVLGEYGEVFVVDWGLSKVAGILPPGANLDDLPPDADRHETEAGIVVGTPAYMAPELLDGVLASALTDIYSLGAILYAILTGRSPYSGRDSKETIAYLKAGPPRRPSSLTEVPKPLEAICLKAMDRDPDARYPSALELAAEVRRWIADEPVNAYPEPWSRRFARWRKRNRAVIWSALAVLVTSVIGLAIGSALLWKAQTETAQARDRSRFHYETTRNVLGGLLQRIGSQDLTMGSEVVELRRQLATITLSLYHRILERSGDDPTLQVDTARVEIQAGNMFRALFQESPSKQLYTQAMERLRPLTVSEDADGSTHWLLAQAEVEHGDLNMMRGDAHGAVPHYREALRLIRSVRKEGLNRVDWTRLEARALNAVGVNYFDRGQLSPALGEIEESLVIAEPHAGMSLTDNYLNILYHVNYAEVLGRLREIETAEAVAREARDRAARLEMLRPRDNNSVYLRSLADLILGEILTGSPERRAEAFAILSQAIEGLDSLLQRGDVSLHYSERLARAHVTRSRVADPEQAEADVSKALTLLRRLNERSPGTPMFEGKLGLALVRAAELARERDELPVAERDEEEARPLLRRALEVSPGQLDYTSALDRLER
jgi:serine/threonine-protein kinase